MIQLYGHRFAAFVWKPLIALYERSVPFDFRMVDAGHPDNSAAVMDMAPAGQFPILVDGDRTVLESSSIVEYLDAAQGSAGPMIPADALKAVEARQMDGLFDDYIAAPMQIITGDAARDAAQRDAHGVAQARAKLDKAYRWFDQWMAERDWAAAGRFTLADCAAAPALFYADWAHPIADDCTALRDYRARLLARPSVARVGDEARPFRHLFPLGAPDRD